MIWTILICTLPERHEKLKRLTATLDRQIRNYPEVAYRINDAGPSMPTGRKRNLLIDQTHSDYFSFCDDDDMVSDEYVASVMDALKRNPDVVTFNGYMTTNGRDRRNFTIELGSGYYERNNHYYRYPNHLCIFKREKVRLVRFPEIWHGEDYQFATAIHQKKLLKTEVHIEKDLYWYDFQSKPRRPLRMK